MIATSQLQLRIGSRLLADKLDWQVGDGECWSVIGRNGAGKSTLLRTLAGLRPIDGGQVAIQGRALHDWPLDELARTALVDMLAPPVGPAVDPHDQAAR